MLNENKFKQGLAQYKNKDRCNLCHQALCHSHRVMSHKKKNNYCINLYVVLAAVWYRYFVRGDGYIWGKEQPQLANHLVDMYLLETVTVPTITSCGYSCHVNKLCMSFFFHKDLSTCRLHSVMFPYDAPWQPVNGWKYYQVYGEECKSDDGYIHNRHLGSCYKFHHLEDERTWQDAKNFCLEQGSQLAKVDSVEKQMHFAEYLSFFPDDKIYIQGSDMLTEGVWRFDDGQLMLYLNWSPTDPGTHHYVVISKSNGYYWETTDGTHTYAFICEKP